LKNAVKPERKLWQDLKKNTCSLQWIRIENLSIPGCPDLLGYNNSGHFFTVELKVTPGNKVRFSPHQIAFHKTHPKNTFILVKALGPRSLKLVPGNKIPELVAMGHGPWSPTNWIEIQKTFELVA
jgi:Holliday junction resolvase